MWTLNELIEIVKSVRGRYDRKRVRQEEKVGLSLKRPENDSASQTPVRRLTFDVCGMHYTSPHFNIILLQDEVNRLKGKELIKDIPTYAANYRQINFYLDDGTKITFDPTRPISKGEFLKEFGIG